MWTERQQALMKAMGVRLWSPPLAEAAAESEAESEAKAASPAEAADSAAGSAPGPASNRATAPGPAPPTAGRVLAPRQTQAPSPPLPPPPPPPPSLAVSTAAVVQAASSQLSTLDWPALRAAVAGCRACSLCDSRRQTVFGAGHPQARWLVVGEAPGEQEDEAGQPFVGPAGQLLDAMLHALQLSRRDDDDLAAWPAAQRAYIANTLKCRPPRNRNPGPGEVAQCQPFLARQIELLQPQVILALGRFAVQALLGSNEAIGRLRGRVHHYRGTPVIVSYHPAYLLRNPADKARAWDDLCLAAETLDGSAATARGLPTAPSAPARQTSAQP